MLRHTLAIRRDPLGFLALMRDRYGDVVALPIPRPPTYVISSAAGAHEVLAARARVVDKDTIQYRSLALVTGGGLLTALAPRWREQRRVVQPSFHHSLLPRLAALVRSETTALVTRWQALSRPAVVDVETAMMDLTLRIVGRALFGDDLAGPGRRRLAEATLAALDVVIARAQLPVPGSWPTAGNRRLARALAHIDEAVGALVARRAGVPDEREPLLIDLLLAAGWPPQQVRDEIVTFLVAGHETAATGLTWALWLLAGDAAAQRRLGDAPAAAAAHPHPYEPDPDAPDPYAQACADEALRLYPPAWVISRTTTEPVTIAGWQLPAGALLIVSPYVLHRDPRYWADPATFRPERFLGDGGRRPGYLPFGDGPRLCIGRDFARWEMALVLAQLGTAFEWRRPATAPPGLVPAVTLRPAGGMRLVAAPCGAPPGRGQRPM